MEQFILRAIQQEVRRIECKLDSPRTGLAEIKAEVAAVECAIRKLDLSDILAKLKSLSRELEEVEDAVDEIEDKLDDGDFGLEEIKKEIECIEETLEGLNLGPLLNLLNSIRSEVHAIEGKLDNPHFGLEEIKSETAAIEAKLDNLNVPELLPVLAAIKEIVLMIEQKLDSPAFGLQEIKDEVHAIEGKLDSPHFGLQEIKDEVHAIECKLDDPHFGLHEIKEEVAEILRNTGDASTYITTGPVFRASGAYSVLTVVQNNAAVSQHVTIEGFSILPGPPVPLPGAPVMTTLNAGQASVAVFGFLQPPPLCATTLAYEIRVLMVCAGSVGVFSAARTQPENAPVATSSLLPENTVRYEEFKPL